MSQNPKIQCLSNDMVRRLLNTKEELPSWYREEIVEKYGRKLLSSGYSRTQTKEILINGIKGYMNKVKRRKTNGKTRIHLTADESRNGRVKKKMIGRTLWYKNRRNNKDGSTTNGRNYQPQDKKEGDVDLNTRAVLFLDQTPHGELARRVKELLLRLEPSMGFKLRVVERTGRSIKSLLSQSSCSNGSICGRSSCITCNQDCEDVPNCTKTSIVYENVCTECNPGATSKGELGEVKMGAPSLYVGETSRSIEERAQEHWGAARRKEEKSHMQKHQIMEHDGAAPKFIFKLVSSHKTALSRQVKEAVRIRRRGGANNILNSRAEFNRCYIPRLVVEEEDKDSMEQRLVDEEQTQQEIKKIMEQDDLSWEEKKKREQELLKTKRRRLPDGGAGIGADDELVGRRSKRIKLPLLSENWGEDLTKDSGEHETPCTTSTNVMMRDCTMAPTNPPDTGRGGGGLKGRDSHLIH